MDSRGVHASNAAGNAAAQDASSRLASTALSQVGGARPSSGVTDLPLPMLGGAFAPGPTGAPPVAAGTMNDGPVPSPAAVPLAVPGGVAGGAPFPSGAGAGTAVLSNPPLHRPQFSGGGAEGSAIEQLAQYMAAFIDSTNKSMTQIRRESEESRRQLALLLGGREGVHLNPDRPQFASNFSAPQVLSVDSPGFAPHPARERVIGASHLLQIQLSHGAAATAPAGGVARLDALSSADGIDLTVIDAAESCRKAAKHLGKLADKSLVTSYLNAWPEFSASGTGSDMQPEIKRTAITQRALLDMLALVESTRALTNGSLAAAFGMRNDEDVLRAINDLLAQTLFIAAARNMHVLAMAKGQKAVSATGLSSKMVSNTASRMKGELPDTVFKEQERMLDMAAKHQALVNEAERLALEKKNLATLENLTRQLTQQVGSSSRKNRKKQWKKSGNADSNGPAVPSNGKSAN